MRPCPYDGKIISRDEVSRVFKGLKINETSRNGARNSEGKKKKTRVRGEERNEGEEAREGEREKEIRWHQEIKRKLTAARGRWTG